MKAAFHYVVRAKLIRSLENNEFDFLKFEDKFEDESPILAREKAFNHYQNYIDVLLEAKGKKYVNDRYAREELKSYYDPERSEMQTKIRIGEHDVDFNHVFGFGIGVFMVIDKPIPDKIHPDDELYIHSIPMEYDSPDTQILTLFDEWTYYKYYNYDTKDYKTQILFCSEIFWNEDEGPLYNDTLKTPFDWEGYDKPYWWGEPDVKSEEEIQYLPKKTIEELIASGESNQVEFKPALLYNFKTRDAGIGVKGIIAKAICAFLNSNGGFLIIGVGDDGKIQGLDNDYKLAGDKNPKDYFRLEFDQMLEHFLSFSVKNKLKGDFYEMDGKVIFVVTVSPNERRPIFLKGQNEKEFYVRGEASSRKLSDIEEIVNYCIDRFTNQ